MPAIAALAYHRASGRNISQPNQRLSYSENFLYMLDAANKPGCAAVHPMNVSVARRHGDLPFGNAFCPLAVHVLRRESGDPCDRTSAQSYWLMCQAGEGASTLIALRAVPYKR